jgi:hypothetical protein
VVDKSGVAGEKKTQSFSGNSRDDIFSHGSDILFSIKAYFPSGAGHGHWAISDRYVSARFSIG